MRMRLSESDRAVVWRGAFYLMFLVWLLTCVVLGYSVLDQGVTITHGNVSNQECVTHLRFLHQQATGRLTREQIEGRSVHLVHGEGSSRHELDPRDPVDVEVQYDESGRYRASRVLASTTPGYVGD